MVQHTERLATSRCDTKNSRNQPIYQCYHGNQTGPAHHGNVEGQKELRAEDRQSEPCPYFERYVYLRFSLFLACARRRLPPSVQRSLRKNQAAILMSTHNQGYFLSMCSEKCPFAIICPMEVCNGQPRQTNQGVVVVQRTHSRPHKRAVLPQKARPGVACGTPATTNSII